MFFHFLLPYSTGLMNGYTTKEGGLPRTTTYTILGLSNALGFLHALKNVEQPFYTKSRPVITTVFFLFPFIVGASFCTGHHFGKAIRYTALK
jgi:hypothetical protein